MNKEDVMYDQVFEKVLDVQSDVDRFRDEPNEREEDSDRAEFNYENSNPTE